MRFIFLPILCLFAACSGCRFDMEFDLDLTKHQPRVKTTQILPQAATEGAKAAVEAGQK